MRGNEKKIGTNVILCGVSGCYSKVLYTFMTTVTKEKKKRERERERGREILLYYMAWQNENSLNLIIQILCRNINIFEGCSSFTQK